MAKLAKSTKRFLAKRGRGGGGGGKGAGRGGVYKKHRGGFKGRHGNTESANVDAVGDDDEGIQANVSQTRRKDRSN